MDFNKVAPDKSCAANCQPTPRRRPTKPQQRCISGADKAKEACKMSVL